MYGIGEVLDAVREFFLVLLITAETECPIIHPGDEGRSFIPGCIVVEDVEPYTFRQIELFEKLLLAILLS